MNFWKPVIAAVVACLLMAVYVADRGYLQSQRIAAARTARLIPFDVMETNYVELENEFGLFKIQKQKDGTFKLTEPIQSKADEGQVKALVDNFYGAKINQTFSTDEFDTFGFSVPAARIILEGRLEGSDVRKEYELGSRTGTLGRVYIRELSEPNTIMTTNDWVLNQTQKNLNILRDKSLVSVVPESVSEFSISKSNEILTVSKSPEFVTGWTINQRKPANPEWISRVLRSMESLQAFAVEDNPTTSMLALGLQPPNLSFILNPGTPDEVELSVGILSPKDESFYVRSSSFPHVSKVRSRFLREVLTTPSQWQTRAFFWRPADQYTQLEAASGNTATIVQKQNEKWIFPEIPDLPVRQDFLEQYIALLQNLKGFEYVGEQYGAEEERDKFGIRPESFRVTTSTAAEEKEGFIIGSLSSDAEFSYVKRLQDNSIWKVSPLEMKGLRISRKELQDKRIATGFVDEITRSTIMLSTGSVFQIFFEQGNWKFREERKPLALLTPTDVMSFFDSVESIEMNSELITANEEKVDIQFEFFNQGNERIHFMKVYETEFSQRLVETPQGFFFVNEEQFTLMLTRFTQILQATNKSS